MIEVDIRETRDGRAILHHDAEFHKYYGVSKRVSEMDWSEISKLRSNIDGRRPILFNEAAALAAGRIRLMLDVKSNNMTTKCYEEIEQALNKHRMIDSMFILGGLQTKDYFKNRGSHSIGFMELIEKAERGENIIRKYHLFQLPNQITAQMVDAAARLDVVLVAAVNIHVYLNERKDAWEEARKDIRRLLDMGVRYYQIDSAYEHLFK